MDEKDIFAYIKAEENSFKIERVPLITSKSWNMSEHIEKCTAVANAWFFRGNNDGLRPYDDIITPVINVAFRTEGFDVKDIVPYVDSIKEHYKSFLIKKVHPQWAKKHELDTFIDDVVETSVIYDLVLIKNINNVKPEAVDLKTIAFCDQTDIMAGPICLKHQYTIAEIDKNKSKWNKKKVELAITQAVAEKSNALTGDQKVKTPSKYIEVYELRGELPETWLEGGEDPNNYTNQMHLVCYYKDTSGNRQGITLYKGEDKPLEDNFFALKIDRIRSKGRACGRSVVESLFEPVKWNNYSAIKIKELLDSAVNVFQTDSEEYGNQKITELKLNTVLKHEPGRPITKVDGSLQNLTAFTNQQTKYTNDARIIGSASDAQLGTNPVSGTPFALQSLVVQQGQGIHEYRQGKIATFFSDVLYPKLILPYLIKELNVGKKFSEELSLEEMIEISETIASNKTEKRVKEMILDGKTVNPEMRETMKALMIEEFKKGGSRKFFEIIKGELKDIPVVVKINIKGKQKDMAKQADAYNNVIRAVVANPQAFAQIPGISKLTNEMLENSGLSPMDFTEITKAPIVQQQEEPKQDLEKLTAIRPPEEEEV